MSALNLFHPYTTNWFTNSLGKPTEIQELAWPSIASGNHTLVSAPTGTGKTLSAFLVFIDKLKQQARVGVLKQELQVIYISPLKSLAGDIRENLRRPLEGISEVEYSHQTEIDNNKNLEINIAIRTGDTTQSERRKMIKQPPHILITTPESLYLMLTSTSGKSILHTAKVIIIDELHAIIDTKRGAHLMLTIARLDQLCQKPLQRIGLSATIEPIDKAAEYLSPDLVTIAVPKMQKKIEIKILSPLSDMPIRMQDSIWRKLASTIYQRSADSRSVIAFVEGRMHAEKLAHYINEIAGDGYARTHHGSLSKEQRFEVEQALRDGHLRILCATSSMELGIDIGEIDQVYQIGCPRTISSTLQRLGRAGHNPYRTSVMYMFPKTASDGLYCGMTAEVARNGKIENAKPPRLCLDILAQHLVSMAVGEKYHLSKVMEILPRAYPFREITLENVKEVLAMLAGDFEHELDIPVRPRVLYDRIHETVEGDTYSRMLAIFSGGTIPDKGMYVAKTEEGIKLGELEEEFVYESRLGDKFVLGTFSWQIIRQEKDAVIVKQAGTEGAKLPFWKGEMKGRGLQTSIEFGKIIRSLRTAHKNNTLSTELHNLGLDELACQDAESFIDRQIMATGVLPDEKTIIMEHYCNANGDYQIVVHSIFGRQINAPLAILVQEAAMRLSNIDVGSVDEENGFLIYTYGENELPVGLLKEINPLKARSLLEAILPTTALFTMTFRYNSSRALMMGVKGNGRQPLWVQRLRSSQMLESIIKYENHPLIRETKRECLEDLWDLSGVEHVLKGIQTGSIQIREIFVDNLSPMSLPMQWEVEARNMYDYFPVSSNVQKATETALNKIQMINPSETQLEKVAERLHLPENEKQLHSLLMMEGDLLAGELEVPIDWLEDLIKQDRVSYIEPGIWIAAEQTKEYQAAFEEEDMESKLKIVRRVLRYRGPQSLEDIQNRYLWTKEEAKRVLSALVEIGNAVKNEHVYYHAELYERAQHATIKHLRKEIKTMPAQCYASLLVNQINITAPSIEQLNKALGLLCGQAYPLSLYESVLLPGRVDQYREQLLDTVLSEGNFFWRLIANDKLTFFRYDDIDWDHELSDVTSLNDEEKKVYEVLAKRGASFTQMIAKATGINSVYDVLLRLIENGIIYSDHLGSVREIINNNKKLKASSKQRINIRIRNMSAGRFDVVRPLLTNTIEQQLEDQFDRVTILSKETIGDKSWKTALETLRIWEYTGKIRRGYFIEGMSGIQFIRSKDFEKTMLLLEQDDQQIVWVPAIDPAQPWGKYLLHMKDRAFLNVVGTVVGLKSGLPVAVFEKKGKTLRVFDKECLYDALIEFKMYYERKRVFSDMNRLILKQYPKDVIQILSKVGFIKEMQDYVLYRK